MRSTIAAFLMSVPLSAIGLMAVFGIPQMAPGSLFNKSQDDDIVRGNYFDEEEPASRRRRSRGDGHEDHAHHGHDEESAPAFGDKFAEDRESRSDRGTPQWKRDEFASRDDARGNARPASHSSFSSDEEGRDHGAEPRAYMEAGSSNLTWKAARQRLAELGVTHFHLERGATADNFLFVCMFSPGDDPRVTRRFEAEAPEPLAAVDGVLRQIDGWMQKRFAYSNSGVSYSR